MRAESHLIHATDEFEKLKGILKSRSLRLSYSKENFKANGKIVSKAAHPMVCFSEFNLDRIDDEIITYGKFAVGFDKDWARKKKIGPVLYIEQNSLAAKGLESLLRARQNQNLSKLPSSLRLPIMELKCFIKNETGYNSHTKDYKFNFKAENEWRFVPKKDEIDNFYISQNQNTFRRNHRKHNEILSNYPLRFELKDLKVIFVSNLQEKDLIHSLFDIDQSIIRISNWKVQ